MCITFSTEAQRKQMSEGIVTADLAWRSPSLTEGKRLRLHNMALSPNPKIRVAAAGNPMTDYEDMLALSTDPVPQVRGWVLRNPTVPEHLVIQMLENDTESFIKAFAQHRLSMVR
jgi:hypothetical protein